MPILDSKSADSFGFNNFRGQTGRNFGKPINPRNLNRSFKRLINKSGVTNIRFHDLRHTHVALMIAQNEPVKLIAERLGHSKITTTMDTYGHLFPNMQKEATNRLDATIFSNHED